MIILPMYTLSFPVMATITVQNTPQGMKILLLVHHWRMCQLSLVLIIVHMVLVTFLPIHIEVSIEAGSIWIFTISECLNTLELERFT